MRNNVNVTADNSIPAARASGLRPHASCRDNASYSLGMRRMECVSHRLVISERVYSTTWITRTNALCSGFVATAGGGPSPQGTSPLLAFNCETRWGLRLEEGATAVGEWSLLDVIYSTSNDKGQGQSCPASKQSKGA